MVTCSHCGCLNDEGVVFCRECYQQIKVHSKKEIARLQQTSLCPKCDYYNPIEESSCLKCGTPLREADFVVTGKDGRESVVRNINASPFTNAILWIFSLSLVSVFLVIGYFGFIDAGGIVAYLAQPGGKVLLVVSVLAAVVLFIEAKAGAVYRAKLITVFFIAFLAFGTFAGLNFYTTVRAGNWDFGCLLLLGQLVALLYSIAFLVRTRLMGSVFAVLMAFIGLYCTLTPIVFLSNQQGILLALQRLPVLLGSVPQYLGPSFLTYHLFFPYVLIEMFASALKALLQSMEKVDGTKSIARFLNRRKEEARGELLNLFVVGITMFTGFYIMVQSKVPNIISLVQIAMRRYF